MVKFDTGINLELAMKENKASTGKKGKTSRKCGTEKTREGTSRLKKKRAIERTRGVLDVKLSQTNCMTCSGLGGISTCKTGTENALRGANDVPAAARIRSKLRPAAAQYLGRSDTNKFYEFFKKIC